MTPLRQQMIDAMQQRGFSNRTHQSYLAVISQLAGHYHRSPDTLSVDELQRYFNHLVKNRHLSGASCRVQLHAVRFFFLHVLQHPPFTVKFDLPKKAQRIPELLTRSEVARILAATENEKQRMLLATCYGCGLRVSELVALKVRHIDGERRLLRVEQGKGAKDRLVEIAPALLQQLRRYWCRYRPGEYLFFGPKRSAPLAVGSAQKYFTLAKRRAGIDKIGGIHSLRHAYATH
ncbi:MAG: tyrosine-type recombinase/integrase [Gammaproteobacteria bacterium]